MIEDQGARTDSFRVLHRVGSCFLIPNAWDPGSARILTALGFEAIATTSAGFAWSLGRVDGGVTREEALARAGAIVRATPLPVSADLENGFGAEPDAVAKTIRMAGEVGLAGASIEDASNDPGHPIYDPVLAVERIAAAVEANRSLPVPLVLTARAENFLHGRLKLDDTIRRLVTFQAAGADVLYAPGLPDLDAVGEVCRAVDRPVNVLAGGGSPPWPMEGLAAAGATRISVGSALARAAISAFAEAAREMRDSGSFQFTGCRPGFAEIEALMDEPSQATGARE